MHFVIYGLEWCFSNSQNCNLRTWKTSRNTFTFIPIFFYNILNKITKRTKRKRDRHASTHTQLCDGFQTAHMFYLSPISTTATEKSSLKLFWVLQLKQTKSFIHIESSVNWKRVQYRNPVLHSMTFLCFRRWPVRNELFLSIGNHTVSSSVWN